MEGSTSEVGTPPPHNLDINHALVSGYVTTNNQFVRYWFKILHMLCYMST